MKHFVVGVDWYGPYLARGAGSARQAAALDAAQWAPAGLYCAIGPTRGGAGQEPLYFGLSTDLPKRLRAHRGLEIAETERGITQMWLGYPATAEYGGRRDRAAPRTLDDAECCHINAMQPPFNDMRRLTAPANPVTVLNRWWTADGRPRQRRPHASWPDLIDYQGPDGHSRMVWFGGRVRTYDPGAVGAKERVAG